MGLVLNRPTETSVGDAAPGAVARSRASWSRCTSAAPSRPAPCSRSRSSTTPTTRPSSSSAPSASSRSRTSPSLRGRVFVGYAGWSAGQLESELEEESWLVLPAEADDLFSDDPDGLWSAVLRRQGGPYALLSLMPPDPSLN